MTDKDMPCFLPSSNKANTLSFLCSSDKFPGFDKYSPVTFSFKTNKDTTFDAVLKPEDYIKINEDGKYELLFRFAV